MKWCMFNLYKINIPFTLIMYNAPKKKLKDITLKKTSLLMIASASMLLASPAVINTTVTQQAPQKGMFIMKKPQAQNKMMNQCKTIINAEKMAANKLEKKMMKQKMKMNSPFLIKHGLPHLTKMIMPYMNNPAFNLTAEQKEALAKVRVTTMTAVMEAKQKVIVLRKDIVTSSQSGVSAEALKDKVATLALLEAAATMTHLKCIESTKAILTKDQMYFLLTNKNKKMNHGKKQMRGNGQPKMMMLNKQQGHGMKCKSGKCAQMNK